MKAHTAEFLGTILGSCVLAVLTTILYLKFNDANILLMGAGVFTAVALIVALR